jgi:Type II secretion system (T2SS), protein F
MAETEHSVTNSEIATFCRQFSSLVHAEINILDILESLHAQTSNPYMREVLDSVREDVEMGRTLATAFSRYPQTFSPFFISMVRQGELEGELDRVFADLAAHFESRLDETPDAARLRGAAFDWESATTMFRWMFAWIVALFASCALAVGALVYANQIGAMPGNLAANICILLGIVLFLAVLLLGRGRRS